MEPRRKPGTWTHANYFESHNSNLIVRCSHDTMVRAMLIRTKGVVDR